MPNSNYTTCLRKGACSLIREGITLYIEDFESANRTNVNGREVSSKQPIRPGDTIQLSRQWSLDWNDPVIMSWSMPQTFVVQRCPDCEVSVLGAAITSKGSARQDLLDQCFHKYSLAAFASMAKSSRALSEKRRYWLPDVSSRCTSPTPAAQSRN